MVIIKNIINNYIIINISLIYSFIDNNFIGEDTYKNTIGTDFFIFNCSLSDGSVVNCNVMDTCGQEKFKSYMTNYYREADGCLLVYDVTNRASFEECKDFYFEMIEEKCKPHVSVILVGNKVDLINKRTISSDEGNYLAESKSCYFMESSCKTNHNVANCFEALVESKNINIIF